MALLCGRGESERFRAPAFYDLGKRVFESAQEPEFELEYPSHVIGRVPGWISSAGPFCAYNAVLRRISQGVKTI